MAKKKSPLDAGFRIPLLEISMELRYEAWLAVNGMSRTQFLLKFTTKEEALASKALDQVRVGKNDAILLFDTETKSQLPLRMGDEWPR